MGIRADLNSRETRPPLLGDPVLSHDSIERLKIPDNIALRPENVIPFLANQWGRMNQITNRPEIKALSGDIPPFDAESPPVMMTASISQEERSALDDYSQEFSRHLLSAQSDGDALQALDRDVDQHLRDMHRQHPEWFRNLPDEDVNPLDSTRSSRPRSSSSNSIDPFDVMFDSNLAQESEEQKRQWEQILLAAKSSPDLLNTMIGMRQASKIRLKMGKLVELRHAYTNQMDRLSAEFDLSRGADGNVSATQLAQYNARVVALNGDQSNNMQMIQSLMGDYERITNFTKSASEALTQPLKTMIQNMRS